MGLGPVMEVWLDNGKLGRKKLLQISGSLPAEFQDMVTITSVVWGAKLEEKLKKGRRDSHPRDLVAIKYHINKIENQSQMSKMLITKKTEWN